MIERRLILFCLGEKEKNKNSSLLFFVSFTCFFSHRKFLMEIRFKGNRVKLACVDVLVQLSDTRHLSFT